MEDEILRRSDYYDPEEAAKVLSRHSGKTILPDYVRTLARYGKIRKVGITSRANLYYKEDVDAYIVEERGVKSARAKRQKRDGNG